MNIMYGTVLCMESVSVDLVGYHDINDHPHRLMVTSVVIVNIIIVMYGNADDRDPMDLVSHKLASIYVVT